MRALFLSLSVLALLMTTAHGAGCVPTTSESFTPGDRIYMTHPAWLVLCHPECIVEFWVYEESNGIEGWQRADEQRDDTCGGQIPGDTIIL